MPRPRQSVEQHKLSGTYQPSRHANRREVQAAGDLTAQPPPAHLTEPEQTAWREICAVAPPKLLKNADTFLLETLVTAIAAHRGARRAASLGVIIKGANGPAVNPAYGEQRRQARLIAEIAGKFGMTPASRLSLLNGTPAEPEVTNPAFAQLFGGLKVIRGNRAA
jgi:P27 family predicted phage terminase small subunit